MSHRARARHRANQRAATPLSSLGSAVSGSMGNLGRGGVVIAMSSGLVATMALPAHAVGLQPAKIQPATSHEASPATLTLDRAFLASSASLTASVPVTAPATAAMTFDTSLLRAVKSPAPKPVVVAAQIHSTSARASRSGRRTVLALPRPALGSGVLAVASRYFGIPYRWGGTTPSGFDCSGYVGYVLRQVGINLPRTANEQMGAARRISRSQARPGDLVFFVSGGHAYHVGIYVGGGMMYDSPRPGKTVGKHAIWSSSVVFGRP